MSGSYDYDAKIWDFGGMTASFKPFRSFEPKEGHQVRADPLGVRHRYSQAPCPSGWAAGPLADRGRCFP